MDGVTWIDFNGDCPRWQRLASERVQIPPPHHTPTRQGGLCGDGDGFIGAGGFHLGAPIMREPAAKFRTPVQT